MTLGIKYEMNQCPNQEDLQHAEGGDLCKNCIRQFLRDAAQHFEAYCKLMQDQKRFVARTIAFKDSLSEIINFEFPWEEFVDVANSADIKVKFASPLKEPIKEILEAVNRDWRKVREITTLVHEDIQKRYARLLQQRGEHSLTHGRVGGFEACRVVHSHHARIQ